MSRTGRVVHLTTVHHPYDPRIYHKECTSLQKAGYKVTLIAQKANTQAGTNRQIDHITIKSHASRIKRMVLGSIEAYKKAKSLKADVYHFHDPELLPVGWLLKRKNNVVIYDIHEDYITSILQKDYLPKPFKKIVASTYRYMEKFFIRKMQLCLAEKYYQDFYPSGIKVLNYPTISEKLLNAKHDKDTIQDKLLYTGNVSHVRGALEHAKIPKVNEHVGVHFIGKCPKELAEEMKEVAGEHKSNLTFEGIDTFVEKEAIEDAYVNTNWLAGIAFFPPTEHYKKKELTKFFEYMAAGLPVICSNFPVWKQFIDKYECGLTVDPGNDNEINEAIEYLREHPEIAKQMGDKGKQAVKSELNWDSQADKLITWYDQLLKQKRGRDIDG
ncbi:glycosyltransferase [Oceanobacillus manasiensis]|uniref:glycosyltransferase n=1 Tax=Oceanobacillus manasiensis TaxID=586413 RepID=UPI0005A832A5|nr:glycosyltransferase [Oceanobacillus manasiensis]